MIDIGTQVTVMHAPDKQDDPLIRNAVVTRFFNYNDGIAFEYRIVSGVSDIFGSARGLWFLSAEGLTWIEGWDNGDALRAARALV